MVKKVQSKAADAPEVEFVPDAWPRFERMIKAVAKAGPQHRDAKPPKPKLKKPAAKMAKSGRRKAR
jgi:hypothetical protein